MLLDILLTFSSEAHTDLVRLHIETHIGIIRYLLLDVRGLVIGMLNHAGYLH